MSCILKEFEQTFLRKQAEIETGLVGKNGVPQKKKKKETKDQNCLKTNLKCGCNQKSDFFFPLLRYNRIDVFLIYTLPLLLVVFHYFLFSVAEEI